MEACDETGCIVMDETYVKNETYVLKKWKLFFIIIFFNNEGANEFNTEFQRQALNHDLNCNTILDEINTANMRSKNRNRHLLQAFLLL